MAGNIIRRISNRTRNVAARLGLSPDTTDWTNPYESLRKKWVDLPTSRLGHRTTMSLAGLSDEALLEEWEASRRDITTGEQFQHRGWYHALYKHSMRGKKVLDVGSGFAIDSITFAQHGARLTFADLSDSNLNVVRRLCKLHGLTDVQFLLLDDVSSLRSLDTDFDVIMAMGSLHHAPVEIIKPEVDELIKHLKIGGRWLQLAYPKTRWIREGRWPFHKWGEKTDGEATPWSEWYDLPKLLQLLAPARFEPVMCREFHNDRFIWFDLLYQGNK